MDKTEILLLWNELDDILDKLQIAAAGNSTIVQGMETAKEDIAICLTDGMDQPIWNYIPACGEVVPDTELNEVER